MKMTAAGWALVLLFAGNPALAQTPVRSFDELKKEISAGDTVQVTDETGKLVRGKVAEISSSSLTLKGKAGPISASAVREIRKRRKDSLWNGLLIGGGIGTATGMLVARSQCTNDPECSAIANVAFIPAGLAIGMVAGALIDRSMAKWDTVFTGRSASGQYGLQISPFMARKAAGIHLSIRF